MAETNSSSSSNTDNLSGETTPTTTARKQIESPAKKPRFDKTSSKGKRHGGVSYNKDSPVTSLNMVPRLPYFPIFTSNQGCHDLALYTYNIMQCRDFRFASMITLDQMEYVLLLSYFNRVNLTAIYYGYDHPLNTSRLKDVATGIRLPTILAQYIESIGMVETISTSNIVPLAGDYESLFPSDHMVDPADVLRRAGREVPAGSWAVDNRWVVEWNNATARASKSGMKFRKVDNSTLTGRCEMLVSFRATTEHGRVLPVCSQVLTEAEGQLGAIYRFRDYDYLGQLPGEYNDLVHDTFEGRSFIPEVAFSDICATAFNGVSTD